MMGKQYDIFPFQNLHCFWLEKVGDLDNFKVKIVQLRNCEKDNDFL